MKLTINGKEQDFESTHTLASLMQQLGMKQDQVAVELNREIVRREQWGNINLTEGDRLEIVQFVGGGT
jgi:thiamine biosynthesis protein ThiS